MKRKTIIPFAIAFFLTPSLWSQIVSNSVTAITENETAIRSALIKEYAYQQTIRCNIIDTVNNVMSSFSYQDWITLQTTTVRLDGYIVKDFVISNDSVFFCGCNTDNNGIIGFFNIQDLFWGGGNFYIQDEFYVYPHDTTKVEQLNKMVSYINNIGERHIVCIGHSKEKHEMKMACIVDMHTTAEPVNERVIRPWSYNSGVLFKSTPKWLLDIVMTEHWLVTAGFEDAPQLSLRTYPIDDILAQGGPQDYVMRYNVFDPTYTSPRNWNDDEVMLAVLNNDTIVTAASWTTNSIESKKTRKINIAQYRLNQQSGLLSPTMLTLKELSIPNYPYEVGLRGFIGNIRNRRLALLFEGATKEYDTNSIFLEFNRNVTLFHGNTNFVYAASSNRDLGLGGFSLYNNGNQYIMAGRCRWARFIHTYEIETTWSSSKCQEEADCEYISVPPVSSLEIECPFIRFGGIDNVRPVPSDLITSNQIIIKCEE